MFDKVMLEVLHSLIPEYVKTIQGVHNLAGCELPTTTFIENLARLLLPDKLVSVGEPQDYKHTEKESEQSFG